MTDYAGTCARPGCPRPTSERYVLCRAHWWLVPRPLRAKVWQAYREWRRGYGDLEALRAAQQAAVDAVVARSSC